EAVEASVHLSARYLPGRQLPDKSVSLLDTACARVAIGQNATPPAVEDARRRIENLTVEIGIIERESATGAQHDERLAERSRALREAESRLGALESRWQEENRLVEGIRGLRDQIERAHADGKADGGQTAGRSAAGLHGLRVELDQRTAHLRELQGDSPLMQV